MLKQPLTHSLFTWLFLTTGIFAIVGSFYCWGEGWLFSQRNLSNVLIPLADLIVSGPLSIISAYGLWSKRGWGIYAALLSSGVYLFGSVLVFITITWNGSPYPIQLIIPAISGMSIAILFFVWVVKNYYTQKKFYTTQGK